MALPIPKTIREQIAWSYANLARADAALQDGVTAYNKIHHIIRTKLYYGLITGKMSMRSLYDDERLKMTAPQACYYCGSKSLLCVDHLIPRIKSGPDDSNNLIWACRSCNSSKQGQDMLEWMSKKGRFPPILLLRHYIKIATHYCEQKGFMNVALSEAPSLELPFALTLLPTQFPPLTTLKHWAYPIE